MRIIAYANNLTSKGRAFLHDLARIILYYIDVMMIHISCKMAAMKRVLLPLFLGIIGKLHVSVF